MHTHLAGASPQPHAHTTSYARHQQAQPMLAAPRSPVLVPTPGAASPCASYSPSRTHSLLPTLSCSESPSRSCTPASPSEGSGSATPPPRIQTSGHMRAPTLTSPCAQMYRVGTDADAHEQAAQDGKAHKSAAKRVGRRGEGHRSIKVRRGSCPRIRLSPLLGSKRSRRCSRIDLSRMLRRQTRTLCTLRPCCTMRGGGRVGGAAGGGGNRGAGHVQRYNSYSDGEPARTCPETMSIGRWRTVCVR